MEKTVVILLSDKRSGSTMFQRELSKHPKVSTVAYSSHTYLETHHWLKGAVLLQMDESKFSGGVRYKGYGSAENARVYMEDTILGNCEDFQLPEDNRELIFKSWEALCQKFAKPVFFEKSPQLLANWAALELMMEWMDKTEFKVKVIGLVRNPLSVQYSAFKLFHTIPQKRQFGWMEIQNNLLKLKGILKPENFLLLRYEDIIDQPSNKFREVSEFIGINYTSDMGRNAHGDSLLKWKTDPFFQFQLHPQVREIAISLGYETHELDMPEKPEPPVLLKIRYKLKAMISRSWSNLWNRHLRPIILRLKK